MSMFWKILGDICLYFSILGAFPQIFVYDMTLLFPALLCAAGAGVGAALSDRGHGSWRFLGILMCAAGFVLADSAVEYVMLAPAIVYSGALVVRDETSLEYYSFREYFRRAATAWALFLVIIWVGGSFEKMTRPNAPEQALDYLTVLGYGALFCLSGVVLQRQLRLGEGQSRRLTGTQSAVLIILLVLALLGVTVLEYYLQERASSVLNLLGQILRWVFSAPIVLVATLIGMLMEGPLREYQQSTEAATETVMEITGTMPTGTGGEYVQPTVEVGYPWWFVAVLIVVMAAMLCYMLTVHRKKGKTATTRQTAHALEKEAPPAKEPKRTSRAKVRRYYREFLKQERRKGLILRKDQTSQDILDAASADPEAAAALRRVYLEARYNENAAITPEQVKAAKEALRKTMET